MSFLATEIKEDNICTRLNIANYKSCQIWLEGYNSPYTKKAYKTHLSLFCKYYNTDPDSLVELKPMDINYVIHLKKVAKQSSNKAVCGEISVNVFNLSLNLMK